MIIMIRRRRGNWWFVAGVVSERGKMLTSVLALCCCVRLVAATPTEAPCPHGFLRVVETGLCCEQCKPGQFVENRCTENNGPSTCGECPNGYYTAVENYLSTCLKCSRCEKDEEIDQPCTESSDRLCRCKAGFHKADGDDKFCVQDPSTASPTDAPSGGKTAGIVVAVILLLFVAAAVAAFIYKKKGGRFPCEGEPGNSNQQELTAMGLLNWKAPIPETGPCAEVRDMDESMAAKLIRGKRPDLKQWIGRDPTYLLDYLDSKDLISRDIYHGARDITVKEERANFLIDKFIDRDECLKLWRALESLQDKYPQLEEWISACVSTTHHVCEKAPGPDANVQCSTAPGGEVAANEEAFRRLTACSDEQLLDGITTNMTALVEAIEGDVRPVLTKLYEKEIFTLAEMNAVSTTQTNKGGSEAASQLITKLLHKGDSVAREFWMALWNLKTNYPRIHKIIENVLVIIEPAG